MKPCAAILVACLLGTGACGGNTGVVLTVHGSNVLADQLRLTATFDGQSIVRMRPETPSPTPLALPTNLFAELVPRSTVVVFTVEALQQGHRISSAETAPLQITPSRVVSSEVDLTIPTPSVLDMAGTAPTDLAQPPNDVAPTQYPSVVLADQPLAYYRFEENAGIIAQDSSPNGLHGVYGNLITKAVPGLLAGAGNVAAQFNGGYWTLDGIVKVPWNAKLEPATAVSIELWMRQPAINGDVPLLVYGDVAQYRPQPPYGLNMFDNAIASFLWTTNGGGGNAPFVTATRPAPNQTYYVVKTYDGTNIKLYVNGVLEAQRAFSGHITGYGPEGLGIGSWPVGFGGDRVFAGTLDEVAIYPLALTPQQVLAHYTAGIKP